LEIYVKNDLSLVALENSFVIFSAVPLTWTKPNGSYPVLAEYGDAVGKLTSTWFIDDRLNNTSPDSIRIVGISSGTSNDLPQHLSSTLCYSLKFRILGSNTPVTNGVCVDNIIWPSTGEWVFIESGTDHSYAPTYNGVSSPNASAGPICFNIVPGTTPPVVTTSAVSNITPSTAQGGGTVTSDGGAAVTVRGVCWSTIYPPTVSDSKTVNGSGTGSFTSSLTGMTANTPYWVRAYATSNNGTGYGAGVIFVTTTPVNGDVNCDGIRNVSDAVYLINWIFAGGPAPCSN
jgi:hypothetical protein